MVLILIDTSFQVLRGLEGSENQRLQALEKQGGIFSDFEVRGQRGEKYLLTNQAPQGKARPLGTGTPQGAKVPAGIRKELYSGTPVSKFLSAHSPLEKRMVRAKMNRVRIFCRFGRRPLNPQKYSRSFNVLKCCKLTHNWLNL